MAFHISSINFNTNALPEKITLHSSNRQNSLLTLIGIFLVLISPSPNLCHTYFTRIHPGIVVQIGNFQNPPSVSKSFPALDGLCAAINIGNLETHRWIFTKFP